MKIIRILLVVSLLFGYRGISTCLFFGISCEGDLLQYEFDGHSSLLSEFICLRLIKDQSMRFILSTRDLHHAEVRPLLKCSRYP